MSTLIELAAQRLEQLRQAGVDIPEVTRSSSAGTDSAAAHKAEKQKAPPVVSRRVELDLQALASIGIVMPSSRRSLTGDQYRVIKRPLILNAMGKGAAAIAHGNLIMVTSALAGEGKTFTALNLAMSIAAELDHTVMLVDADVPRPSISRMLEALQQPGSAPAPGLLDVLEGRVDLSGALLKTNVDKLTLLPSGTFHRSATELLASDAMGQLLDEMATRYPDRIIVFDSPPLLVTTEARVLASRMGQIVIVVQAGKTLQSDVQYALGTIESCPVRLLLLNQVRAVPEGSYSYGYGHESGPAGAETPTQLVRRPERG